MDKLAKHIDSWEEYRKINTPPFSEVGDSFGCFFLPTGFSHPSYHDGNEHITVNVGSKDPDWFHVTAHLLYRTPTWDEMCYVKNLFIGRDVTAIQFHPEESQYVNTHPYMLHIWVPKGGVQLPDLRKVYG